MKHRLRLTSILQVIITTIIVLIVRIKLSAVWPLNTAQIQLLHCTRMEAKKKKNTRSSRFFLERGGENQERKSRREINERERDMSWFTFEERSTWYQKNGSKNK